MSGRLAILLGLLTLWTGAIALRLAELQVFRHAHYVERAQRQHQRVLELHPPRGTIYDHRGRKLAVSVQVRSAFAVPHEIEDPEATARTLAPVVGQDWRVLAERLARDREFVWVARKLDDPVAERVRALELPGIAFVEEAKRYYPNRELAAAILGYVGTDNLGLGGLEVAYDRLVSGTPGRQTVLRDARRGTAVAAASSRVEPKPGADLHLTLDAGLQHVAERELAAAMEKHRAEGGSVVVLDPWSGAVLAMASLPSFDPNRFSSYSSERWRNAAVMDAFEPGSTFKVITVAAALEHNLVDPTDTFDCERGSYAVQGIRMRDHKPFGVLSVAEILQYSSNVGAMKVGLLSGGERFHRQIEAFGFGRPTGIDLPGESPGLVMRGSWRPLTTANVAFGQGISVTPLQLASSFAAVATGGVRYRPYVVEAVRHEGQLRRRGGPVELDRPITAATARSLERMMTIVVEAGTGRAAAIPGHLAAGKTGTAQKALPGRGYVRGHYVASFAGFAPARDPRVVVVVTIDEPRAGGYYGGQVAAPVFGAVVGEALRMLGVAPDRPEDEGETRRPGQRRVRDGAQDSEPDAGWQRILPPRVALREQVTGGVPDFAGLTAREALVRAAVMGIEIRVLGDGGFVERQAPEAESPLPPNEEPVRLWLGRATG